jgi:hypothetical protein
MHPPRVTPFAKPPCLDTRPIPDRTPTFNSSNPHEQIRSGQFVDHENCQSKFGQKTPTTKIDTRPPKSRKSTNNVASPPSASLEQPEALTSLPSPPSHFTSLETTRQRLASDRRHHGSPQHAKPASGQIQGNARPSMGRLTTRPPDVPGQAETNAQPTTPARPR